MSNPRLTEERLKSWLDTNQVQQERMCIALLSLNKKYSNIKPRRPKGGPDGARDIEATYENKYECWGAVGFQNSVSDSSNEKRQVRKKFSDDLSNALKVNPNLDAFVFFTNIDLTPSEESNLAKTAKDQGIKYVEIFYRERLRILLDSPEGLGLRFQYLSIPLSEAEQAAFFERFGAQLENLLLKGFDSLDKKLARIEFLQHCKDDLRSLGISLKLKRGVYYKDLSHFRIYISILDVRRVQGTDLVIQIRDNYTVLRLKKEGTGEPVDVERLGFDQMIYSQSYKSDGNNIIHYADNSMYVNSYINEISCFLSIEDGIPLRTIGDINGRWIQIFVTQSLFDYIKQFRLILNNYEIISAKIPQLQPCLLSEMDGLLAQPDWKLYLTDEEEKMPWLMLGPSTSLSEHCTQNPHADKPHEYWTVNFDTFTPGKAANLADIDYCQQKDGCNGLLSLKNTKDLGIKFSHYYD